MIRLVLSLALASYLILKPGFAFAATLYDYRARPHVPVPSRHAHASAHHRPRRLIVGGMNVAANDPIQRSTAAMYSPSSNGPGGSLCTASLIAPNMAVTAAHCVQGDSYSPVMIFGNDVRSPQSVRRPITGEIVNPAYGKKRGMDQGDIALVKFGGGLPPGFKPASLDSNDSVAKGERAILAGYGVSNARTKEGAGILRKTEVAVANPRTGKSEMIFDQSHGHGACHGDSGGPAYFKRGGKMILGGVTNRSYPNTAADDCAHKVVYTKIASYRPWIEKGEAALNRAKPASSATQAPVQQQLVHHMRAQARAAKAKRITSRPRKLMAHHTSKLKKHS